MTTEVQVGYQEKFLSWKSGQALEEAARESGGVTIPESVKNLSGCGTLWHGSVEVEMVGFDALGGLFQA